MQKISLHSRCAQYFGYTLYISMSTWIGTVANSWHDQKLCYGDMELYTHPCITQIGLVICITIFQTFGFSGKLQLARIIGQKDRGRDKVGLSNLLGLNHQYYINIFLLGSHPLLSHRVKQNRRTKCNGSLNLYNSQTSHAPGARRCLVLACVKSFACCITSRSMHGIFHDKTDGND